MFGRYTSLPPTRLPPIPPSRLPCRHKDTHCAAGLNRNQTGPLSPTGGDFQRENNACTTAPSSLSLCASPSIHSSLVLPSARQHAWLKDTSRCAQLWESWRARCDRGDRRTPSLPAPLVVSVSLSVSQSLRFVVDECHPYLWENAGFIKPPASPPSSLREWVSHGDSRRAWKTAREQVALRPAASIRTPSSSSRLRADTFGWTVSTSYTSLCPDTVSDGDILHVRD